MLCKKLFSSKLPQFDPKIDYYKILSVNESADGEEVKREYYKLAQQYHPDKNNGRTSEKFKEISNAYSVIGDPE